MKNIHIITGAGTGLGREFAIQTAKKNPADEIWLIARRTDKLQKTAQLIGSGTVVKIIQMDLAGKPGVESFSQLLQNEYTAALSQTGIRGQASAANQANQGTCGHGGFVIKSFINNAGFGTYGEFMNTSIDRQIEMIELNCVTFTGLCYACIPFMAAGSVIINIASLAAFSPLGNFAVYGATKAFAYSFSIALAAEVADKGIFVETVCPGPVDTEFALVASNGARKKVVDGKSAAAVVRHTFKCISQKKHTAVMAPKWKFKAFMSRFISRYAFARWTFIHEKRPSQ
jgi:short-subunit dehydrogenase